MTQPNEPETARGGDQRRAAPRKPSVLFVDDEKRVLNSMRALFRRDYDLHLTTSGEEAVRLCSEHDIDVIVADQRMPGMTGVDVLGAVKESAPRTVRILLTGYADLDAIEGSINVGEVFRFLSKPCPPDNLRETLRLAIRAAGVAPAPPSASPPDRRAAPAPDVGSVSPPAENVVAARAIRPAQDAPAARRAPPPAPPLDQQEAAPEADTPAGSGAAAPARPGPAEQAPEGEALRSERVGVRRSPAAPASPGVRRLTPEIVAATGREVEEVTLSGNTIARHANAGSFGDMESVGVVVFTVNDDFERAVEQALRGHYQIHYARTLSSVIDVLAQDRAGVMISDISGEGAVLRKVLGQLKQSLPELIAIVVSDDRDAAEMISLINHGQIFRYMAKPMNGDRLLQNVNGGALRHLQMQANPSLIPRFVVEEEQAEETSQSGLFQMFDRIRTLAKLWKRDDD